MTAARGRTVVKLTIDRAEALVNDRPVTLPVPAMIIDSRTFEMEALGLGEQFGNLYAQGRDLLRQAKAALAEDLYRRCSRETDSNALLAAARLVRFITVMGPAGANELAMK